jgi:uracil phosphoribosyltransferase
MKATNAATKTVTRKPAAKKPVSATAVTGQKKTVAATVKTPSAKTAARKPAAAKIVSPVIRDSFTMTAADHELLKKCKRDAISAGRDSTKKSEIVRAALRYFASLSAAARLVELNSLDPVKTGRPNKKK